MYVEALVMNFEATTFQLHLWLLFLSYHKCKRIELRIYFSQDEINKDYLECEDLF
jgi:hypothetical protein